LFQFSLKDKAKQWFLTLPANSIRTWGEMQQVFLDEYYSMAKTDEMRDEIRTFQQQSGEPLHEAFTRFKELIRKCPHHQIELWELVKSFVNGLTKEERKYLKSTSNGTLLNNPEEEDWEFLERMSKNSRAEESADRKAKHPIPKSTSDVDFSAKDRIAALERELARMKKKDVNAVQFAVCEECGDIGHRAHNCQVNMAQGTEEVNQVYGDRKPYDMNSNTYHLGLRNHPNFRYGNPSNQMNPNFQPANQGGQGYQNRQGNHQGGNYNQGGYQRNNYNQGGNQGYNRDGNFQRNYNNNQGGPSGSQGGGDDSLNAKLDALMNMVKESNNDIKEMKRANEVRDKSHEALTRQVGQLAEDLGRLKGSGGRLPSDTTVNPQHQGSNSKNTREV